MAKKEKTHKPRKITVLDLQLKADAEALKFILRQRGRNPDWVEADYPNDWASQVFILNALAYD